ncbi:MAG: TlpA family protein disulfide reductase [Bacteroidales bacterium]|nr:TlpA family protein disulfide reductase [Bacteroidales bacterium]
MKFIDNYKAKLKKKSKSSWASDILFLILILALIFPATRNPIVVFVKKATLFGPSVSVHDNFGKLNSNDLQWQLINAEDQVVRLADLSSKPVFINFWATWCAPCIAEMPSVENLYLAYKDKVNFVLVTNENKALTDAFLQKQELNLPIYRYQSREPKLLSSKTIPATFILNKRGKIVVMEKGTRNWNSKNVRELLDKLIAE